MAFSKADKKFITLNNSWMIKTAELTYNDFMFENDPSVQIISRSDKVAQDNQDKANLMAIAPMILQDPNTPKLAQIYLKRKLFSLNGQDRDEVLEEVPPYYEEIMAKQRASLIDEDLLPDDKRMPPPITDLNEDHMTYLMIYQ
jgi:hypothetical protein